MIANILIIRISIYPCYSEYLITSRVNLKYLHTKVGQHDPRSVAVPIAGQKSQKFHYPDVLKVCTSNPIVVMNDCSDCRTRLTKV
ncbi:hypothetical protein PAXRUDRAFT_268153 [Paxillus rubicundulus Ve08.2h10]|uniref:Uncharacterized protein n=1 Tax=Paxillus rubicundulus Ve08.2h10 TaxID=930991 RepID=A0A0D0DF99_9AGAM|nr:hypothetical protein PAXRUDRAFT_268153 [Paxillus rubicundulus Ve08.2h10]